MKRALSTLTFVVTGVAIGNACQYAAVAWLGTRLGFAVASLVGLAPFVAALALFAARYPQHFRQRRGG